MAMKKRTVKSLEEYIKALRTFSNSGRISVFRGHSNNGWSLISSGDRKGLKRDDYHRIWLECYKHNYDAIKTKDFIDTVVNMQHYMLPTKLLDWTYNPLVALYFAVEQYHENDGEVIVAYPHEIYEPDSEVTKSLSRYLNMTYHTGDIFEEEMNLFRLLRCGDDMFFCVAESNERIQVQAGLFSIHIDFSKEYIAKKTEIELMNILGNKSGNDISEEIKRSYNEIKQEYMDNHKRDSWNTDFFLYIKNNKSKIKKVHPLIRDILDRLEKIWIWEYYMLYHTNVEVENKSIIIPSQYKSEIKKDLKRFCNIHAITIYPDFSGYSEYIRNCYLNGNTNKTKC